LLPINPDAKLLESPKEKRSMIPVRTIVLILSFVCLAAPALASAWQEVAEFL